MPTIWGVKFGRTFFGGLKPWINKAKTFAEKTRWRNSLRNSPAISENSLDQRSHPKSALQNFGIKNFLDKVVSEDLPENCRIHVAAPAKFLDGRNSALVIGF